MRSGRKCQCRGGGADEFSVHVNVRVFGSPCTLQLPGTLIPARALTSRSQLRIEARQQRRKVIRTQGKIDSLNIILQTAATQRVDANHLSLGVQQWPATVTVIDCRVG